MQQYLFRGKRKNNGEWVEGSITIEYDGTCHINYWVSELTEPENNFYEMVHKMHEVIPETVGQWTGMVDMNGVKIFEGDFYHTNVSTKDGYQVMFVSGAFVGGKTDKSCSPLGWQPDDKGDDLMLDKTERWLTVVGNIHDVNPTSGKAGISDMQDPNTQTAEPQQQEVAATESAAQDKAMEVESAEEGGTQG